MTDLLFKKLVPETRFELVTNGLSSRCSTTELPGYVLAEGTGIEPVMTESKSVVLPLH